MLASATTQRQKARFPSGDTFCAAWHYPGSNGACVIMAAGLAVTKEAGTDRFAARFSQAGFSVLAFDYRRLGESGGRPRQVVRLSEQLADWDAAIAFVQTLPEVDPARLAIWGFSLSGGHVLSVAARNRDVAAAIAHSALIDGQAAAPEAARHTTPAAMVRLTAKALADTIGLRLGREPLLVPLTGEQGEVAAITTPDSRNGPRALNPGNRYPEWRQEVAASSALRIGFYRPIRAVARIECPLLIVAHDDDGVVPSESAAKAARLAPRGELARLPGGHYGAFLADDEQAAEVELEFLRRHLTGDGAGSV